MLTKYNIDIIIPNYNKSKYLEQCINSVIDQSYKNWNLYIVDDCSSDDSLSVLKKYNNNKQIEVIKLNKNKGPAFCRNLAMRISNSEYISFLDSDDYWKKDKLYKQLNFMEQNKYKFTYIDYLWCK